MMEGAALRDRIGLIEACLHGLMQAPRVQWLGHFSQSPLCSGLRIPRARCTSNISEAGAERESPHVQPRSFEPTQRRSPILRSSSHPNWPQPAAEIAIILYYESADRRGRLRRYRDGVPARVGRVLARQVARDQGERAHCDKDVYDCLRQIAEE